MSNYTKQPTYILPQKKKRVLIPKMIALLFLSIIFYLGVILNISLLEITSSTKTTFKLSSVIILTITFVLGILINNKKAKQNYIFYQDKIVFQKKEIYLSAITDIQTKQNILDKLFRTYSLTLNQKFKIKNISQKIKLQEYIQKLIAYSRSKTVY